MSIATERGDGGTTQLFHGPRVSKADPRVEAYGCLDELGAQLGLARALAADDPLAPRLEAVQRELFVVGAELACPPAARERLQTRLEPAQTAGLSAQVHELEALPQMLSDWALPGATVVGSLLDVARTVCRRTERRVVALFDQGTEDNAELLRYLNRLADLLWLYARWFELRQEAGGALRAGRRGFGPG